MAERMIEANGVQLCTDTVGDPGDPPVLLIMGMSASLVWWEEEFCARLAGERRFVIRYDHRDTGRSITYDPGHPSYTASDLVADAAGVLDAYDLAAAHVVGLSMGGALAQLLTLDYPDRVLSLVLLSTSPATPGERGLPPAEDRLGRFLSTTRVDPSNATSVVDYLVEYWRALWGPARAYDERHVRALARHDVARARNLAAAQNHALLPDDERPSAPLSSIAAPTLVIHGTEDPMFPLAHGSALADEVPGGKLLALPGGGHGLDPADWDTVIAAIADHTHVATAGLAARPAVAIMQRRGCGGAVAPAEPGGSQPRQG